MAYISRNTFDKLKKYVSVRMQQGVPLLDADWNEKDDIRKEELQLFLKWFVGNGIPKNNDGFRILPTPGVPDDFLIKGGESGQPGICLVEGWDVRIETDTAYSTQPLFNNNDLAQKWGAAPLVPLTPPLSGQRTDLVYLDAWEREVNSQEDPNLVNPATGRETCLRIKREWVVRVAPGTSILPEEPPGHVHYPLANITRTAGNNQINPTDIYDLRRIGMTMSSTLDIFVGSVSAFPTSTAPAGWLECSGQAVNRRDYSALFERIGTRFGAGDGVNTFNVPDLRGEFIRGWDHERGIDSNRTFGSFQVDQIQGHKHPDLSHTHAAAGHTHSETGTHSHTDSGHSHSIRRGGYFWGRYASNYTDMVTGRGDYDSLFYSETGYANLSAGNASTQKAYETILTGKANVDNPIASTNGVPRQGSESRPRNVALMYCIKY